MNEESDDEDDHVIVVSVARANDDNYDEHERKGETNSIAASATNSITIPYYVSIVPASHQRRPLLSISTCIY